MKHMGGGDIGLGALFCISFTHLLKCGLLATGGVFLWFISYCPWPLLTRARKHPFRKLKCRLESNLWQGLCNTYIVIQWALGLSVHKFNIIASLFTIAAQHFMSKSSFLIFIGGCICVLAKLLSLLCVWKERERGREGRGHGGTLAMLFWSRERYLQD